MEEFGDGKSTALNMNRALATSTFDVDDAKANADLIYKM
jgi:hypothetical protein